MSRKHFIALAKALKESKAPLEVVKAVADELHQFNSNFDRTRFLEASKG